MIDAGLAFAPAIALVMTVLLAALCINLGLGFHGLRVFAALTAGTWLGGQILVPVGPLLWEVSWLSFVIAGLTAAALHLGLQVLSGYMTRFIAAHLDSLATARRSIRASLSPQLGRVLGKGRKPEPFGVSKA